MAVFGLPGGLIKTCWNAGIDSGMMGEVSPAERCRMGGGSGGQAQ